MKRKFILIFVIFIILSSLVSAEECSLTNLGACVVEFFFDFILDLLNSSIEPLLDIIYDLLTEPVSINIFSQVWSIIVYILSMFYGFLIVISGFRFIVSGYSPEQREKAKSTLTQVIIMMILVQASFLLYEFVLDTFAALTEVIFNMIDTDFFFLTFDNFINFGLELLFLGLYITLLIFTMIILVLRYICVSAGVLLFTIGIFFYFISPLNQYGRLIINGLAVIISLPFFYSLIFLASSKLLTISLFRNIKILVMIGAFGLVNTLTLLMIFFVLIKAATKVMATANQVTSIVQFVS